MDTQKILEAIETIVKKQITDNNIVIESKMQAMGTDIRSEMQAMGTDIRSEMQAMGTDLESKMQTMADSAAHRALGLYEERLESLLKVNSERLPDLIETTKGHEKRIDQVEQKVSLYGVAIKNNSVSIKTHHDEIKKIRAKVFA